MFNKATLRRWFDIFLLGLMASAICLTLWPLLQKVSEYTAWLLIEFLWPKVNGVTGGFWAVFLGIPLALVSLAVIPLVLAGALRWGHFRTFFLYPPVWLAGLWPVGLIAIVGSPNGVGKIVVWESIGLLTVSSLLMLLAMRMFGGRDKRSNCKNNTDHLPTAAETLKEFANDPAGKLIPWLESDAPVENPSDDLFESHLPAEQIAKLVTQQKLKRVGLIGPYGSGKTTVLNLVDYFLHSSLTFEKQYHARWREEGHDLTWIQRQRPPKILTCRVGAWGFAKEAAATVVLREAVAELSKHMDCLSVRGLPQEYMAAMKSTTPSWVHAPIAASVADNPLRQLKRLDPMLEAINSRLIIFIEDLDRNIEIPNDSAGPNGRVFLEVESLLDRMKDVDRVSFVLAIDKGLA